MPGSECDAKIDHMKEASVRDLRYDFKKIERLLRQGEEIRITKRRIDDVQLRAVVNAAQDVVKEDRMRLARVRPP